MLRTLGVTRSDFGLRRAAAGRTTAARPHRDPAAAGLARSGAAGHSRAPLARPRQVSRVLRAEEGLPRRARAARHPAAGLGSGRRRRRVRAAQGGRGARRRAHRRADRSESGLRRPPPAGARVLGVRLAARRRRPDARARRSALRGPLPVRPVAGGDPREEPAGPIDSGPHLRGGAARGGGRPAGLGKPPAARRARRPARTSRSSTSS